MRGKGFPDFNMDFADNEAVRIQIGKMFDIPEEDAKGLESIDAMREYLYERDVPVVMEAQGVSESLAKQIVSQSVTNQLRPVYDAAQEERLRWMSTHKAEAKEAAEAGLLGTLSKAEKEILGIQ